MVATRSVIGRVAVLRNPMGADLVMFARLKAKHDRVVTRARRCHRPLAPAA
jgi:hypothetical protein